MQRIIFFLTDKNELTKKPVQVETLPYYTKVQFHVHFCDPYQFSVVKLFEGRFFDVDVKLLFPSSLFPRQNTLQFEQTINQWKRKPTLRFRDILVSYQRTLL